MIDFFKENWLWILIPILLVLGVLGVLILSGGSGEEGVGAFDYPVF
jgi:hypothetical protein